jgi:hypothetical protein
MGRLLERLAIVLVSVAFAVAIIALLSGGLLAGRDTPGIAGGAQGPGTAFTDQGDAVLRPGELRPVYDSDPPTSGPHAEQPVAADGAPLNDDQLLEALQVGDVVLMYGTLQPPAQLGGLVAGLAPPFSDALAASGQAVVMATRPGTTGILALAWAHMLRVSSPSDPALRAFISYWLGRGAPRHDAVLPTS